MKIRTYITLYSDGSIGVWAKRPEKRDHQEGTRFFETFQDLPLVELCEWQAQNHRHLGVKEIAIK